MAHDPQSLHSRLNLEEALTEALEAGGKRHCANCFTEFEPVEGEQTCSEACHKELVEVVTERALTLYPLMMRHAALSQSPDATKEDLADAKAMLTGIARVTRRYLIEDAQAGRPLPREAFSLEPMTEPTGEHAVDWDQDADVAMGLAERRRVKNHSKETM